MARSTYSVTQAQSQLPQLLRQAESVSRDYLEAIVETLEILANPHAQKAIADHRAGRTRFVPLSALDADG